MFSQIYFSFAANEVYIIISGMVKDTEDNFLGGVKVYLLDTEGNIISNTTTNSKGEYSFKDIAKGRYKIKFEYTANYEKPEITFQTYSVYSEKVELAYLYNNAHPSLEGELENIINERLTNEQNRKIVRLHSNLNDLKSHIRELELNINNPNAFQKVNLQGYKGILIVNTNEQIKDEDINEIKNTDYKYAILNTNNTEEILNKIVELLNTSSNPSSQIVTNESSIKNSTVESNEIDFQTSSTVNLKIEKNEEAAIYEIKTDDNITLVAGNIYENNDLLNGTPVRVSLIDLEAAKRNSYITYNGQYEFKYPKNGGDFIVEFEINSGQYNGQNYKLSSQEKSITNAENINQNTGRASNIAEIKEHFKNITTKQEEEIVETENSQKLSDSNQNTKLIIQTNTFTLQPSSTLYVWDEDIEDYVLKSGVNPYYYGSIKIEEREKFILTLEKYVESLELTLADDSVLVSYNHNSNNTSGYIATTALKDQHVVTIDNEIKHGSTLSIVYAIKIKNNSNIDCDKFTIIDYLTYDNMGFTYNENAVTINNKPNSDYWKSIDYEELKDYIKDATQYENDARFNSSKYLKYEGTNLNAGQEQIIYLSASKVLTTTEDVDSSFLNETEIIQYSNDEGRRNYNTSGTSIQAGNYCIASDKNLEEDSARVSIKVLPPYGENKNDFNFIYVIIIILIFIIFFTLKKQRGKSR